jgi:hypothetical protein
MVETWVRVSLDAVGPEALEHPAMTARSNKSKLTIMDKGSLILEHISVSTSFLRK